MTFALLASLVPALILGTVLGFLGGLFGIGGGIVAIPILVLGYGMDQATAQGTALVMMVPNLTIAWWRYMRRNPGGLGGAAGVAAVATLTTWGAARLAQGLDQTALQVLFALFLAVLGFGQLRRGAQPAETGTAAPSRLSARFLPLVGLAGGSSMGLLGIGGGLVATPIFTGWFGLGQRAAQSLALALVTPSSAMALVTYAEHQRVDWPLGLALGVGGLATVAGGVAVAHAWPERMLKRAFGIMLIGTAAALVARRLI